jgi:ABC-type polar amino acid transport system ATPase subunit
MKQIELKQVSKRFGDVEVIPPIDLEIEEGEFVVNAFAIDCRSGGCDLGANSD